MNCCKPGSHCSLVHPVLASIAMGRGGGAKDVRGLRLAGCLMWLQCGTQVWTDTNSAARNTMVSMPSMLTTLSSVSNRFVRVDMTGRPHPP